MVRFLTVPKPTLTGDSFTPNIQYGARKSSEVVSLRHVWLYLNNIWVDHYDFLLSKFNATISSFRPEFIFISHFKMPAKCTTTILNIVYMQTQWTLSAKQRVLPVCGRHLERRIKKSVWGINYPPSAILALKRKKNGPVWPAAWLPAWSFLVLGPYSCPSMLSLVRKRIAVCDTSTTPLR